MASAVQHATNTVRGGIADINVRLDYPGGDLDQVEGDHAIVNYLRPALEYSSKVVGMLSVGETDPSKDLDVLTFNPGGASNVVPIYLDPLYEWALKAGVLGPDVGENLNTPAPKAIMVRMLYGSGVLHLNALPDSAGPTYTGRSWVVPVHGGVYDPPSGQPSVFFTTLGKSETVRWTEAPNRYSMGTGIFSIWLRTFEEANQIQIAVFR